MNRAELKAIIASHRRESLGSDNGELNNERADALDHYHGRPYGDERQGRSAVVSKDLKETVGWIMPAVMKVFASSDVVEFMPQGQDDEDKAQQETAYVNHVIMKDNRGFLAIHDAVKDALLLKNGYIKHYWCEADEATTERYAEKTEEELTMLMEDLEGDGKVEVLRQDSKTIPHPITQEPVELFDVELRITRTRGKCIVEAVPVEEVRVSTRCRGSLQESPFTEHITRKRRSDLIEMGMPADFVSSLASYDTDANHEELRNSRDTVSDENTLNGSTSSDRSMDEIEYCEAYIRVDYDGDGIAELRKVVTVADRIPPGDEWNEEIDAVPLTSVVIERVPHRHVGESLDDELADLQRIKTNLTRGMLDNVYITNNQTYLVNERVNLSDFMRSIPGGVRRVKGNEPVDGSARVVETRPILDQIIPAISYIDSIKSNRTGIDKSTTGVDPDLLKQTTKGSYMESLNRASQKVEMIIRMIGETGIREVVEQVHKITLNHQDFNREVQLRGRYVNVNPREWKERTDLTIKVGIGTGSEDEKRQKYMIVSELQDKLLANGGAAPPHAAALFQDVCRAMDFDIPEKYAFSPEQVMQNMQAQQGQEQPNPLAEAEMVKGQMALERQNLIEQSKMQMESMKREFDAQMEHTRAMFNAQIKSIQENQKHEHQMHVLQADLLKHKESLASNEDIEALKAEVNLIKAGSPQDIGKPGIGAGIQDG